MLLDGQFANERFTGENDQEEFETRLAKRFLRPEPDYSRLRIRVSCVCPPIPLRNFDYLAYDDATYDGPGCALGEGPTAQAAILDLITQISERDDTDPFQILLELTHAKGKTCDTSQPAAL